jgi:hypothetical protein
MRTILFVAMLAACAKRDAATGSGTCKLLSVTVDGTALPAMPHGLAKANNMNGDVSYEVLVFNHAKTTCDQLMNRSGYDVVDGEVSVRAFAGGAGMTEKGVAIDAHTQMGGNVTLVGSPPKAVGDVVEVCADNVAFKPIAGKYKDTQVVVTGLFAGQYCGELKW